MLADVLHQVAAMEAAEQEPKEYFRRPSVAGPERCLRQMVYWARGDEATPITGRALVTFDDGHWHEALTIDWISKTAYRLHSNQMTVTTAVGKGHIDGIITDGIGRDTLFEHKSINHFGYERLLGGNFMADHLTQAALYLHSPELADMGITDAVVLYKNKNQGAYTELLVEYDATSDALRVNRVIRSSGEEVESDYVLDDVIANAIIKFDEVDHHVAANTLPPRQYEYDHWRCQYCGHFERCWSTWREEHASLASDVELEPEVADMIRFRQELGAQRSDINKQYDEVTDQLRDHMKTRGLRSGYAGEYAVDWPATREKFDRSLVPSSIIERATVEVPNTTTLRIRKLKQA